MDVVDTAVRWLVAHTYVAGTVMVVALVAAIVLGGGVIAFRLWRRRAFGAALPGAGRTAG